jgi:hypothetical protein
LLTASKIKRSSFAIIHSDLTTRLTRTSLINYPGDLNELADCTDPCTCKYKGVVELLDVSDRFNMGIDLCGLMWIDVNSTPRAVRVTLKDYLKTAVEVRHKGTEIVDGHSCAVIEARFPNGISAIFWLDEVQNGLLWRVDNIFQQTITSRMLCTRVHEAFPGIYIPGELSVFTNSDRDDRASALTQLDNKRELVKLSFSPEDWPNAEEKDFGFRFMPNSVVNDARTSPPCVRVIGKDLDDVLFTFFQMHEFDRWCSERSKTQTSIKDPSETIPNIDPSNTASSIFTVIGIAVAILVGGVFLYFRVQRG